MSNSPRILFTTIGSYGDLHPYMAIAIELKRLGCVPTIATHDTYRDKIESAGIEFVSMRPNLKKSSLDDDLIKRAMSRTEGAQVVVKEIVLDNLNDTFDDILAASTDVDLIVSHVLTFASPIVAEIRHIPWIFTGLQPFVFFSAIDPSSPTQAPWFSNLRILGPKIVRSIMNSGFSRMASWSEPILELRRRNGLKQLDENPMYLGQFSPYHNLALFSKHFAQQQKDWPSNTTQAGFPYYDDYDATQRPMPEKLKSFLDSGKPPIVFTLGTAAVHDPGKFFVESIAAANKLDQRAVLLTGIETENINGLRIPDTMIAVDYAPYSELMPCAVINVHQGGIGTTAQAMRAGKPMIFTPYAHDQPDNAGRAKRLGIARSIDRDRYNCRTLMREISKILNQPSYFANATEIARKVKLESGALEAAKQIHRTILAAPSKSS